MKKGLFIVLVMAKMEHWDTAVVWIALSSNQSSEALTALNWFQQEKTIV
jgi:hypothetical protein